MTKKPELNDLDKIAFQEAMKGVKRLDQSKKIISPSPPAIIKPRTKHVVDTEDEDLFQFSDYELYPSVRSEDLIEFFRSGIQQKTIRQMRSGQFSIEAKLDLHGLVVVEARDALARFIMHCQRRGMRQVLLVHGKGRPHQEPILKNKLNHWLRQNPDILAFCSARSKEGGTGALYVLLKRVL